MRHETGLLFLRPTRTRARSTARCPSRPLTAPDALTCCVIAPAHRSLSNSYTNSMPSTTSTVTVVNGCERPVSVWRAGSGSNAPIDEQRPYGRCQIAADLRRSTLIFRRWLTPFPCVSVRLPPPTRDSELPTELPRPRGDPSTPLLVCPARALWPCARRIA